MKSKSTSICQRSTIAIVIVIASIAMMVIVIGTTMILISIAAKDSIVELSWSIGCAENRTVQT